MEQQTYCSVWSYYSTGTPEENVITCSICQQEFPVDATPIDILHKHLSLSHNMTREAKNMSFKVQKKRSSRKPSSSQIQIEDQGIKGTQRQMKHEKLSQMELLLKFLYDTQLSLPQMLTDKFVRAEFVKNNEPFPKSKDELLAIISTNYVDAKAKVSDKIKALILQNQKFNLMVEEWAEREEDSCKLYLVLRVFTQQRQSMNLGCLVFKSTETPEVVIIGIQDKLRDFGISLHRDVTAIYSEGSNVVRDAIKMSSACEQFCYNRALHSAILNVLFCEEKITDDDYVDTEVPSQEHNLCNCELKTNLFTHTGNVKRIPVDYWENAFQIITDIISLLKTPDYKETFENIVREGNFSNLPLFLACPYDWMLMCSMLKNFFALKEPIKKTLTHFRIGRMWKEPRMKEVHKVYIIFNEILSAMENLSTYSATLVTADQVLMDLLNKLQKIRFPLSQKLSAEIKTQIGMRRNVAMVSLINILENYQYIEESRHFKLSPNDIVFKMASLLYERLFASSAVTRGFVEKPVEALATTCSKTVFLMTPVLESPGNGKDPKASGEFGSLTRTEFDQFITSGIMGEKLDALHKTLICVDPTFTRSDTIGSTSPTIFYSPKEGFTPELIDQINIIRNILFNN